MKKIINVNIEIEIDDDNCGFYCSFRNAEWDVCDLFKMEIKFIEDDVYAQYIRCSKCLVYK